MTDPLKATPPAIVRVDSAEMDQLAFEITSALEAGAKAARTTLERYREAGDALIRAKAKCKHGEWLPWLKQHGIHQRDAARSMLIAEGWSKLDTVSNLTQALRLLTDREDGADSETTKPQQDTSNQSGKSQETAPSIFCRPCRVGTPKKGCKDCEALRRPPRDAGDDTESEDADKAADKKAAAERRKANAGNGQVLFDWKNFQSQFGPVAQAPDKIAKGYPNEKDSPEFREAQQLLQQFIVLMERWQKRLQRTK